MRRFLVSQAVAALAAMLPRDASATDSQGLMHSDVKILRSGLAGLHHAQPRLHDLRHAVRHRREAARSSRRWSTLDERPDASTWDLQAADGGMARGTQVTSEDCVASLKRGGPRFDGQEARGVGPDYKVVGHKHLPDRLKRSRPLLEAIGKRRWSCPVCAQGRRGDRRLQADRRLKSGAGPFMVKKDDVEAGEKLVSRQESQLQAAAGPSRALARRQGVKARHGSKWIGIPRRRDAAQCASERRRIDMLET